jgi:hypothetical protein
MLSCFVECEPEARTVVNENSGERELPPSPVDPDEFERALGRGAGELPENRPAGLLGETPPDWRKVDSPGTSLFGGITQDVDTGVEWLGMLVAYFVFFPVAYVILWRSRRFSRRAKFAYTIAFTLGLVVFASAVLVRRAGWVG